MAVVNITAAKGGSQGMVFNETHKEEVESGKNNLVKDW